MHLCPVARCCAARVDNDQFGAAALPGCKDALIQDRVAPCEVRADQNDQVRLFQIVIGAGHGVGAKGPLMPCDGRGHAQTRVGVDIGRADVPFHQLIGDVVVFGQQLPRDIESHTVRAVFGDGLLKPVGHQIQRTVPVAVLPIDQGPQLTALQPNSFRQCGALRTQTPPVRRVVRIAAHCQPAGPVRRENDTATHPAIGAGRARFSTRLLVHQATLRAPTDSASRKTRPPSTLAG